MPDTQQMLRNHLRKQTTLSKLQFFWLSAHLVPSTVSGGAGDRAVDKTQKCSPSCHGAHSQVGKMDSEYIMTRVQSTVKSKGCRAMSTELGDLERTSEGGRSCQMKGIEGCKRALRAEGTA